MCIYVLLLFDLWKLSLLVFSTSVVTINFDSDISMVQHVCGCVNVCVSDASLVIFRKYVILSLQYF